MNPHVVKMSRGPFFWPFFVSHSGARSLLCYQGAIKRLGTSHGGGRDEARCKAGHRAVRPRERASSC